ncbi:hypothetical protein, partial [Aequorivita antarctica]|uniref:hypothetical protein n=1 Tax=Aequorivita antarctica TaxID=153266 RepID=UPI001B86DB9C
SIKIVRWNALTQTEIVEELFLVDLFSLHTMKLRKIGNLCNRHTVYKPLLGLCSSGKFLGIFQRSFVSLMVRAFTRNGPYTTTFYAI